MPQERLTMRKIREILRLKWELGLSNRMVARGCRISHSTVGDYVKRAQMADLRWPLPEELDEDRLYELLYPRTEQKEEQIIPRPNWDDVHTELRKKGVTLRLLWMEYLEAHPTGYGYSQFCELYRRWRGKLNPTMRLNHKAGEIVCGLCRAEHCDHRHGNRGERLAAKFVALLGASSYFYAEAQWSQALPNWINGHVRAFEILGGAPEVVVPDHLKAGVTKPCRYEPGVNLAYQEMTEHYGVAVVPARARKPRDKAKAESGVNNGLVTVFSHHTTCSVMLQECSHDLNSFWREFLQVDLIEIMEKLIPTCRTKGQYYHPGPEHIKFALSHPGEEDKGSPNTDAHLRSSLFGRSEKIILENGKLSLGDFAFIYFVD